MDRKEFLSRIGYLIPISILSCKTGFTTDPTTIKGIVVNEDNLPLAGVLIKFKGTKSKGFSSYSVFETSAESDENGEFSISYTIPQSVSSTCITIESNDRYNIEFTHKPYILHNNLYVLIGACISINVSDYGKSTFFNFQLKSI